MCIYKQFFSIKKCKWFNVLIKKGCSVDNAYLRFLKVSNLNIILFSEKMEDNVQKKCKWLIKTLGLYIYIYTFQFEASLKTKNIQDFIIYTKQQSVQLSNIKTNPCMYRCRLLSFCGWVKEHNVLYLLFYNPVTN